MLYMFFATFQQEEYDSMQDNVGLKVGSGPIAICSEAGLQVAKICRQAYHSQSFVGNDIHRFFKVKSSPIHVYLLLFVNIGIICDY